MVTSSLLNLKTDSIAEMLLNDWFVRLFGYFFISFFRSILASSIVCLALLLGLVTRTDIGALDQHIEHRSQLGGLLVHLLVLFLDFLHVVMKAEHFREFRVGCNLIYHILRQTDVLLLLCLWLCSALLFVGWEKKEPSYEFVIFKGVTYVIVIPSIPALAYC